MSNTIKIIIFGNSGSGKSTLALECASKYDIEHLDLDTLAWKNSNPPSRKPVDETAHEIKQFLAKNSNWVIEGCYSDLLSLVINNATKVIFLNPGVETCIANCKKRPWEPHKYESIEKQNDNLAMLLNWVKEYPLRKDEFSLVSHQRLFDLYNGDKTEFNSNN